MTRKEWLFGLLTIVFSLLFCVLLTEIALRFLPVNEGLQSQSVTFDQPVHKFRPDDKVRWSRDWNFSIVNTVRVNNAGYVNDYDYTPQGDRPVLAVIGDSYVEAAMVPFAETLHGRLAADARATGAWEAYSFGAGGAPLSQYLVFARHARENYNVGGMVFVIIGNDFDESLPKYKFQDTFHQFVKNDAGGHDLRLLREYRRSWWKSLIRESALVRYLYFNMQLSNIWWQVKTKLLSDGAGENQFVGNTVAATDPERMADSRDAVDLFFRMLPDYAGLPPRRIVFVVDAAREKIYGADKAPLAGDSYFEQMRQYFMQQARAKGYGVVDMTRPFFDTHKATGARFEFPTDGHWNAAGHAGAYEALRASPAFRRLSEQLQ